MPVGSCSEEGIVQPLPGLAVAPVPCDRLCPMTGGLCHLPRGCGRGVAALHPRAAQQEGRGREAEVLCCSAGAILGEILG